MPEGSPGAGLAEAARTGESVRVSRRPAAEPLLLETEPLRPAAFVARVHRFVVKARIKGEGRGPASEVAAYMANPGRMWEMLLPGTEMLLAPRPDGRLRWEAVGLRWQQRWPADRPRVVFLNAGQVARVARRLLEERLIPELSDAALERAEAPVGRSRIDFLLSRRGAPYLLEVKSATLVEHGLALFPDARSERAVRHLETLAATAPGRAGVLFVVQGSADRFLPDFHNDLDFAVAFNRLRGRLDVLAYQLEPRLDPEGRLRFAGRPRALAIPWQVLEAATADSGLYILLLHLAAKRRVEAGALGCRDFAAGWYAYAGSARKALSRRLQRHIRLSKRHHYHIDALRAAAGEVRALAIRATGRAECDLAAALRAIADWSVPRFGSSDCRCPGHLFHFAADPLRTPAFQRLLTDWRHRI